jgi:hypothetical protein
LGTVFGFLGSVVANLIHNPVLVLIDRWVGGFLLSYLSDRPDAMILRFALGLCSGGLFSFYLLAAARYQAVAWGLSNFEKLDAEFKQKWAARLNEPTPI